MKRASVNSGVKLSIVNKALQLAKPALSRVDFVPSLCNFKVTEDSVTAFNGCLGITINRGFSKPCLIPGDLSLRMLGSLSSTTATMILSKNTLNVQAGRSKIELPTMDVSEFVVDPPEGKKKTDIKVTQDLVEGIKKCLVAAGLDATFPELLGVSLFNVSGKVTLFSSDNYLLSRYDTKIKVPEGSKLPVVLPTDFCSALLDLVDEYDPACSSTTLSVIGSSVVCNVEKEAVIFTQCPPTNNLPEFEQASDEMVHGSGKFIDVPEELLEILSRSCMLVSVDTSPSLLIESQKKRLRFFTETANGRADESCGINKKLDEFSVAIDPTLLNKVLGAATGICFHEEVAAITTSKNHVYLVSLLNDQ